MLESLVFLGPEIPDIEGNQKEDSYGEERFRLPFHELKPRLCVSAMKSRCLRGEGPRVDEGEGSSHARKPGDCWSDGALRCEFLH